MAALTFTRSSDAFPLFNNYDVELLDANGDGALDAFVATMDRPGHGSRVYINDGSGRLIESSSAVVVERASLASGDLDGDGDLDVIAAANAPTSGRVPVHQDFVFLNDGAGRFERSTGGLGGQESGDVRLADVDGNGTLDALFANVGQTPANQVFLNDGTANFTDTGQSLGDKRSGGLAVGDIDGDGDVDMVSADLDGSSVWLNDGAGTFTDSGQFLAGGGSAGHAAELADIDGDGDLDLVVGKHGDDEVYRNDGDGGFTLSQTITGGITTDAELADFDLDGDLDLLQVLKNDPDRILLNDGAGNFADSGIELGDGTFSNQARAAVGDIDGDGDLDIYAITARPDTLPRDMVFLNQTNQPAAAAGVVIGADRQAPGDVDNLTNGLLGEFYRQDDPSVAIGDLAGADAIIDANDPDGTFDSLEVNYPSGPFAVTEFDPSMVMYLGTDTAATFDSLDGPVNLYSDPAGDSVWQFSGFIRIDGSMDTIDGNGTIDIGFVLRSDDGSRLRIGGEDIIVNDTFIPGRTGLASFEAPGLYPIEVTHFDDGASIGIELLSTIGGPRATIYGYDTENVLESQYLFHEIRPADTLPELAEKQKLSPDLVEGVDRDFLTIGKSGDATITFLGENAAFESALGVYRLGEGSRIEDVRILFPSTSTDGPSPDIAAGESVQLSSIFDPAELAEGTRFGLFVVSDGAKGNLADLAGNGTLAFIDEDSNPATIRSEEPTLVHVDGSGQVTPIDAHGVFHTSNPWFDFNRTTGQSWNTLNDDVREHVVSGEQDGRFVVAFEDKSYRDDMEHEPDFNDILVAVETDRTRAALLSGGDSDEVSADASLDPAGILGGESAAQAELDAALGSLSSSAVATGPGIDAPAGGMSVVAGGATDAELLVIAGELAA